MTPKNSQMNFPIFRTKEIIALLFLILFFLNNSSFSQETNFENRISVNPLFKPFYHGVASGDPLHDRVILWTRVTPDSGQGGNIPVAWKIAEDTTFQNIIDSGTFITNPSVDYTVKVDASGLQPGKWYYYVFKALNQFSVIGRTKTLPDGDADSIRFATVSGSNYNAGYFNAYHTLANRNDIDAIFHLGDYIYEYANDEYGNNPNRNLEPLTEVLNLSDYRLRYSHYKLDEDLKFAHQQYPWIVIWDDHETANNSYKDGAENHQPGEGNWHDRMESGIKAYLNWMPIREQDTNNPEKIYRKFNIGDLAEIFFLETRYIARDNQSIDIDDTSKTMLGKIQRSWLLNSLDSSNTIWKLIAQQVMFAPLEVPLYGPVNKDQWDGYRHERNIIQQHIHDNDNNVVILTGDIHTSWGNDLPLNKSSYNSSNGAGSVGVEFVTPSITSESFPFSVGTNIIKAANPWIKYVDITKKGYNIVDINKFRVQSDWYFVNTIDNHDLTESYGDGWLTNLNENHLVHASQPAQRTKTPPAFAPSHPYYDYSSVKDNTDDLIVFGLYPNPVSKFFILQYYLVNPQNITMKIYDLNGVEVFNKNPENLNQGLHYSNIDISSLKSGVYLLVLYNGAKKLHYEKIIKI